MILDGDACYRALSARDRRFDGVFFVGVSTTGIYCRPICPARTPGRGRCAFFERAAEAERAGFRACFRCRPEVAPGLARVDSVSRLVRAAAARIDAGELNEGSVDTVAAALGVSARHLRRALSSELGVTPVELAQTSRMGLAKQLLQDTALPLAEVAFASGFASVRRFNAIFLERFGVGPGALRRNEAAPEASGGAVRLRLDHRSPFDFSALAGFLQGRAIPGIEQVESRCYLRAIVHADQVGWVRVEPSRAKPAIEVTVSQSLLKHLPMLVQRLRALFDLDARPDVIDAHLGKDPRLRSLVRARPGLRVPGAYDGFELAIRAVLGQQVSVRAASTLATRLVRRFGTPLAPGLSGEWLAFPSAQTLSEAPVAELCAVGLPETRARSIQGLSAGVASGALDLGPGADPEATMEALVSVRGIGPWTASYLAMRALRWPDAFPAGDLAVQKVLGVTSAPQALRLAERWRPFRSYAVMHLWSSLTNAAGG